MDCHSHYFVSYLFSPVPGVLVPGNASFLSNDPITSLDDVRVIEKALRLGNKERRGVDEAMIVVNYQLLRECTEESCDPRNEQQEPADQWPYASDPYKAAVAEIVRYGTIDRVLEKHGIEIPAWTQDDPVDQELVAE